MNLSGLAQDAEGLLLYLQREFGEGPILEVRFADPVAYRNIDESYRSRTWDAVDMEGLTSFLQVDESSWVEWLRAEAGGLLDAVELRHYAIYTDDDCIDVVTEHEPRVTWRQQPAEAKPE